MGGHVHCLKETHLNKVETGGLLQSLSLLLLSLPPMVLYSVLHNVKSSKRTLEKSPLLLSLVFGAKTNISFAILLFVVTLLFKLHFLRQNQLSPKFNCNVFFALLMLSLDQIYKRYSCPKSH